MKGLSLPTAEAFNCLIGFLIAIFYLTLLKVHRSERTTKTYAFLAVSYGFQGIRRACSLLATPGAAFVGWIIDPLYVVWTFSLWMGVRYYGRKTTIHPAWLTVPIVLLAWILVDYGLNLPRLWRLIPMHLTAATLFIWSGVHLWRLHREQQNWGLKILSVLFVPQALNTVISPFTSTTWYGPYGYIFASVWSLSIGMGLILTALLEEQRALVGEMKGRKQAEEALESERNLLRSLIDNMPDRIYAKDIESRFIICNEAVVRRMGKSSMADIVGKSDFDFLPPEMAQRFYDDEQKIILSGIPMINHEEPLAIEGGKTTRWNLTTKVPLLDRNGNRIGIVGMGRDITDFKQAVEKLRESEANFQDLFHEAPVGYFEYDTRGCITRVNQTELDMLGYSSEEVIGQPAWKFIVEGETCRHQVLAKLAGTLAPFRGFERVYRRKDGTTLPVLIQDRLIRDEQGNIKGIRCAVQDITDRKRAEEERMNLESQLRQSQKMEAIGTLAGGVAHDFNNLLTTIIGYSSLLEAGMDSADPKRLYVDQILTASQKAANLTQSLLAFSRKQTIELKPYRINEVVKGMEKILMRLLTEDITFNVVLGDSMTTVMADVTQIDQVLMNLATNARDAMPKGGSLAIETKQVELDDEFIRIHGYGKQGSYVVITVTDTGCGMDEKTKEKIFEPFFTTKEVGKGTGLGLSTVYGIIKQHSGFINVYSEPGKGTAFRIYLPTIKAQDREEEQAPCHTQGGTETILVAEDNNELRDLMKEVLTTRGYTVIEAVDGKDAVQKFRECQDSINLLILDVVMPKKSGKEAYEEMKRIRPNIKALFASGYTGDVVFEKGVQDDAVDFISKPLSPNDLLIKIREVLDKR